MDISPKELIILDVASESPLRRCALFRDGFDITYNMPCHGLPDDELLKLIAKMEDRNLITPTNSGLSERSIVEISKTGAEVWESIRKPDWNCYIDGCDSSDGGIANTQIFGLDPAICWKYLYFQFEFGFLCPDIVELEAGFKRQRLRKWHDETDVYHIQLSTKYIESNVDLESYYQQQFWWSAASELARKQRDRD